ncbi:cytochrome c-type biogenesis protein CcmH [Deferribacter autotrophicus]|uniref:Cytochrome c-type biogenesis protein n=1 Tax=Deferribacter autotrophicus TaxID=500465 RepID=A0A5A8F034_9BACT|nr:cytochrome c-type biogenesis protein CcmH [Deferribacter autotrophicus]KAA0257152.1 cytochrome c-type biogenesis protein CcmH [Deferribacter autotrophicus]
MKRVKIFLIIITIIINGQLAFAIDNGFDYALFKKIEANLMCTDGCGMYLKACSNNTAEEMRKLIKKLLIEGKSEKDIYAYMINIYGEEVMAAPPVSSSFNILAWVTPFLGLLAGALIIYIALDKWVFNKRAKKEPDIEIDEITKAEFDPLLDEEIKKHF